MSFHSAESRADRERSKWPHPIWRGIGIVMMVMTPLVSFAIADILIQYIDRNVKDFSLPDMLRKSVEVPFYGEVNMFGGVLILTLIVTMAIFAILFTINAIVYSIFREQNLLALESKPVHYKKKKRR